MKPTPEKLIKEIKMLHESNIAAAQSTAERALTIGIRLHQLKSVLDHGEFGKAREKQFDMISERCCRNYMAVAEARVVEEQAMLLLGQGGKSARRADLTIEQTGIPAPIWEKAEKAVSEMDWCALPFKVERLAQSLKGKELAAFFRDYNVLREPKQRGTHERTPRDIKAVIEAAGEVDDEQCTRWCSDTLLLLSEESDVLGGQKNATLQKMENIRLQLGQRIQKILKLRGAKTKGNL